MDPAGAEGGEVLDDDDDKDEPAETAVCAFVANNLHKGSNLGSWKPLQQGWKKREKKEPRRVGDPPLSFGGFIQAHPQGPFICYGQGSPFQHHHWTCPIHKADTEAYRKAHRTKERTSANIWEAKVEVSKHKLSKLMMVGTELAEEIQGLRDVSRTRTRTKIKTSGKEDEGRWRKKEDAVSEVAAQEDTQTTDAP